MSRVQIGEGSMSTSVWSDSMSLDEPFVAGVELDQLAFEPAGIAQPQHGAAADGAPVGLDHAAVERHQFHGETFAIGAQCIDRALHGLRLVRLEPGAERQHALRQSDAVVTSVVSPMNVRLVVRRRPRHQDLRFRQKQRLEAIALGPERRRSASRNAAPSRRSGACAPA